MQVLIFCEFGLKMPIHTPKLFFGGTLSPNLGAISSLRFLPQKGTFLHGTHHVTSEHQNLPSDVGWA